MNCKPITFLLVLAASFALAAPGFAQAGAPDLSEFTGAVSKAVAVPIKAKAAPGVFKSGLVVPSVKPGETARGIGKQIREALEKQSGPNPGLASLETGMPQTLIELENALVKNGFAKRDLGVAYGYAFLDLYENATGKTVPDAPSKIAVRTLATAIAKYWGPKVARLTPANKEKIYESLLMGTTLNTAFAKELEAAGKTDDAKAFKQGSAELFEKLVGVPPAQVTVAADGAITGLAPGKSETVKP